MADQEGSENPSINYYGRIDEEPKNSDNWSEDILSI